MSLPVTFSPEAVQHLADILSYLSIHSYPQTAEKYVRRIAERCIAIGSAPSQGKSQEKFRLGARTTGFERRATILFQVREDDVLILGIFYGGRQLPFILD